MQTKNTKAALTGLLALVLLLGVGVLVVIVIARVTSPGIPSAIIGGALALAVALSAPVVGNYLEKRREVEASQRHQKIKVYESFMSLWFDHLFLPMLQAKSNGRETQASHKVLIPKMNDFTKQVILWGGDEVLKCYSDYRRRLTSKSGGLSPEQNLAHFEKMLFAFRKDLGYRNRGLEERDILALFINDLPPATSAVSRERAAGVHEQADR